jgi:hypothetical protein
MQYQVIDNIVLNTAKFQSHFSEGVWARPGRSIRRESTAVHRRRRRLLHARERDIAG